MDVNFHATLRQLTGRRTVALPLPPEATVRALLAAIIARYPGMQTHLFDQDGQLYRHVHIFVNGRDAPYLEHALETTLSEDDTVDLFPAIGGG